MAPRASRTSPTAFTTTRAPTTTSPDRTAQLPSPPFIMPVSPAALPTVAPVPAPTEPSANAVPALGGEHDGAAGGAGRIGPVSHGDAGDGGEVGRRAVGHRPAKPTVACSACGVRVG